MNSLLRSLFLLLLALASAPAQKLEPKPDLPALELQASGMAVTVPAGRFAFAGGTLEISEAVTVPVSPASVFAVAEEPLKLSADKPQGYQKGTRLKGCNARDVNAFGALVPGSLQLRRTKGGELLQQGEDYLLEENWGAVGVGPKGKVTPADTVYASYQVSQLRVDTLERTAQGKVLAKAGVPHISSPQPPAADPGTVAFAHVLVGYRATELKASDLYPILETAGQATTATRAGRIPKTLAKLRAGQPVTIVCLGDSVTAGGNASAPEHRYVDVFAAGLRQRFPKARIDVQNISAGGSSSRQWLDPERFAYKGLRGEQNPARFERVLAAKPDLVTVEFVNDAGLSAAQVDQQYGEMLHRLVPPGAELILITPHFTMWSMMGFQDMRGTDQRPYVASLRRFAEAHGLAVADAAGRWQRLWKEGLPYLTLLHNTINHPDDRGHLLFAEELWKCFQ